MILVQDLQSEFIILIFRRRASESRKYGMPTISWRAEALFSLIAFLLIVLDFAVRKRDSIDSGAKDCRFGAE